MNERGTAYSGYECVLYAKIGECNTNGLFYVHTVNAHEGQNVRENIINWERATTKII